jgi:hypothetical protein
MPKQGPSSIELPRLMRFESETPLSTWLEQALVTRVTYRDDEATRFCERMATGHHHYTPSAFGVYLLKTARALRQAGRRQEAAETTMRARCFLHPINA